MWRHPTGELRQQGRGVERRLYRLHRHAVPFDEVILRGAFQVPAAEMCKQPGWNGDGRLAFASPLQYLAYLIADAVPTIALIEGGIPVTVPQPARYAVHKLIVAQVRRVDAAKRNKDLKQAKELIEAIELSSPTSLEDAFHDARKKGRGWVVILMCHYANSAWRNAHNGED